MRRNSKGFTLIEILVVIMIIMTLAGLVVGAAQKARERATKAKAQATIASLEVALSMYEVDYGDYPEGPMSNVITVLTTDQEDDIWNGPYFMIKEEDLKNGEFVDPWGNSYVYEKGGGYNGEHYFDIYSMGPNGKFDGDDKNSDDIDNW